MTGYVKNHATWEVGDLLTATTLDNFETIYTEAAAYLTAHNHDDLYPTKTTMESDYWYAGNDGHTEDSSGPDADLLYKSTGNLHAASFAGLGVPEGLGIMWSGSAVPDGWLLCDGTNGTADLVGYFIIGTGPDGTYVEGSHTDGTHTPTGSLTVGGHQLTAAEVQGHQHSYDDYYHNIGTGVAYYDMGYAPYNYITGHSSTGRTTGNSSIGKSPADSHTHNGTFTGDEFAVMPRYYKLAWIQKAPAV